MPLDLLQELMEITDEEKLIMEQKKEVKKELYTSQAKFIIESEKFLSKEKMIMVRKHTRFVDFPKHRHDYIEINYVYNGFFHQKVGSEALTLKKGELLFLNQHIEHEIAACDQQDIIINFIIHPDFFKFIFSYLTSENMVSEFLINSLYNHTQNGQYLFFAVSEVMEIQELLEKMIIELLKPGMLSDSAVKLYMGLLMIELIKHSDKASSRIDITGRQQLVVESLNYIDEHYQQASLFELAEMLNEPHYSVSKKIKQATNHTFKELLQDKRLNKARELLETTDLPIAAVVELVGYENISYFYRIFKSKYGYTPKQLREHM
ncbi:AraC-type DNA-binding protein [Evansella caseinilytica]|uniref:AraC-type DNA-binding protein n=1 Tax=Evansella caseinilytica TaxID=1503961 RepID=A0A1H3TFC5_9BACI|nr:AraC family transcriptional regulator [Evansella caseinilytica]SDZ48647.1 AraC-type DNA-binding protein [Evansella caseinilytica]